ncbi:MAG: hypothetical protein GY696_15115 [Gammaproteobacteria bacterium]|nr:hypothetical protein [Gammaproteobacteria bacterium]
MKTNLIIVALTISTLSFWNIKTCIANDPGIQPAHFSPPQPGTIIVWQGTKNGNAFEEEHLVEKNSGLLARWKSGGKSYERYGLITWGTPDTFDTTAVDPLWPLEVGKSVSFSRKKGKRMWNDSISVIGTETITVHTKPSYYFSKLHSVTINGLGSLRLGMHQSWDG